jgi:hypothetical protein
MEHRMLRINAIDEGLKAGTVKLTSVADDTLGDQRVLKATFLLQDESTTWNYQIFYSIDQGYLPIKELATSPDGAAVLGTIDSKIGVFRKGDKTLYYPTHIERTLYNDAGEVRHYGSYTVDVDSVRFNEPIPDEKFLLQPAPGETIEPHNREDWIRFKNIRDR